MDYDDITKICKIIDDVLREYQDEITDLLHEAISQRIMDNLDINIKKEDYV